MPLPLHRAKQIDYQAVRSYDALVFEGMAALVAIVQDLLMANWLAACSHRLIYNV